MQGRLQNGEVCAIIKRKDDHLVGKHPIYRNKGKCNRLADYGHSYGSFLPSNSSIESLLLFGILPPLISIGFAFHLITVRLN